VLGNGSLPEGLDDLRSALHAWAGGHLADDVALLVVQLRPGITQTAGD